MKLMIAGFLVWVLAGAIRLILTLYVVDTYIISSESIIIRADQPGGLWIATLKATVAGESVGFRLWVASAFILAFLALFRFLAGQSGWGRDHQG